MRRRLPSLALAWLPLAFGSVGYPNRSCNDAAYDAAPLLQVRGKQGTRAGDGSEELLMFLQTNATHCAESLPYSQEASFLPGSFEAGINLGLKDVRHRVWVQELFAGNDQAPAVTLRWKFTRRKTLKERLEDASRGGESVKWSLDPPCGRTSTKRGVWWFSSNAGLGRFGFNWTGSGADFSADDGAWGCGLGTVDGAGDMPEDYSGQANRAADRDDITCGLIFHCGSLVPGGLSGGRTRIYLAVPTEGDISSGPIPDSLLQFESPGSDCAQGNGCVTMAELDAVRHRSFHLRAEEQASFSSSLSFRKRRFKGHRRRRGLGGRRRRGWGRRRRRGLGKVEKAVQETADRVEQVAEDVADVTEDAFEEGIDVITEDLPASLEDVVQEVGVALPELVETVVDDVVDAAEAAVTVVADAAKDGVRQGSKLANEVTRTIVNAVERLGGLAEAWGVMALGWAQEAWAAIADFLACLDEIFDLTCRLLLSDNCDCDSTPRSEITLSGSELKVFCVVKGFLVQTFGWAASASARFEAPSRASGGKVQIPGQETNRSTRSTRSGTRPSLRSVEVQREAGASAPRSGRSASSSGGTTEFEDQCELGTGLALNGEIGIRGITVEGTVDLLSGETGVEVTVTTGLVLEALLEGQGSCSFSAARRFPQKPFVKTVCGTYGCLIVMVQGVAEADAFGSLTGAVATKVEANLTSGARFSVDPNTGEVTGRATGAEFSRKAGVEVALSADAIVRFGLGPEVVIWLIPGVPVTIKPQISLEIRAAGTISFSTQTAAGSLMQTGGSLESGMSLATNRSRSGVDVDACVAVGLNLIATSGLSALGIPDQIAVSLSTDFLKDTIEDAIRAVGEAASQYLAAPIGCFSSVAGDATQSFINEATEVAVDAWDALIPDLNFDWQSPSIEFLTQRQCWEVAQSATGSTDACKERISCTAGGQSSDPSPSSSVATFSTSRAVVAPESYETKVYEPDFVVNTKFRGFVNYGDRIAVSLNPELFDSTCGEYGCAVGYVDTFDEGKMKFGEGADDPDAFYIYATEQANSSECVKFGDEVVIAWSEASSEGCVPGELSHCVESENCEVVSNEYMQDVSLTFAQRRTLCATACFGNLRGLALDFDADGTCRCARDAQLPRDSETASFCTRPAQAVDCIAGQAEKPYIFERAYLTQAACAGACFSAGGYAFDFTLTPRKDSCRCVGKGEALTDAGLYSRRYCTRAQEIFQAFEPGECEDRGWKQVTGATQCARAARFVGWPCQNDCAEIDGGGLRPPGCFGTQQDGLAYNFRTTGALGGGVFKQVCYRTAKETFKQFSSGSSCVAQGWSIIQDAEQCSRAANALGILCADGLDANVQACFSDSAPNSSLPEGCYGDEVRGLRFNPYLEPNDSDAAKEAIGYVCVKVMESEEYDVPRVCAEGQVQDGGPFLFQRKFGATEAAEMSCAAACFASGGVAFDIAFAGTRDSCRCVGAAGAQNPQDDPGSRKPRKYCTRPAAARCQAGEAQSVATEDLLFETSWTDENICAGACRAAASDPSLVAFQVDSAESPSSCRCFFHKNQAPILGHPTRQYCSFEDPPRVSLLQTEAQAASGLIQPTAPGFEDEDEAPEESLRGCYAGQAGGPYLFKTNLNKKIECEDACFTAGGVAFDYTLTLKSDSCRCVGPEGAKNPWSNTGADKRTYCARPQSFSCRMGEVPQSPETVLFQGRFADEAACGAFCWAAGGVASQTGRVVFDYTSQVRKDSCRCVIPGEALPRRPGGGRRMLCRFNDVLSPFCGVHGCSVASDGDFLQFNRGSDVSFQPRYYLRAPAGFSKDGTCIYFGDKVVIAASPDSSQTDCGWYGCKVANVTEEGEMVFQEGGDSPTVFYMRPALAESGSYDEPSRDV